MFKNIKIILTVLLFGFIFNNSVYADTIGLVPESNNIEVGGSKISEGVCSGLFEAFGGVEKNQKDYDYSKVGEFNFDMIGCYIVYLINVASKLAVMIAFVFVLIGAFRYTITYIEGDTDNGDKAKKTIKNALIGLAVATMAYVIVDLLIRFLLG